MLSNLYEVNKAETRVFIQEKIETIVSSNLQCPTERQSAEEASNLLKSIIFAAWNADVADKMSKSML